MFRSAVEILKTRSTLRALRHRYFAIEEIAGFFSGAGVWVYRVGLQVFTWELTHSGVWLGIIALSEAAPGILIAPIAGTLADRYDRLVLAKFIQFAIMLVTAALAVFTLMGSVDIWVLLGFAYLSMLGFVGFSVNTCEHYCLFLQEAVSLNYVGRSKFKRQSVHSIYVHQSVLWIYSSSSSKSLVYLFSCCGILMLGIYLCSQL